MRKVLVSLIILMFLMFSFYFFISSYKTYVFKSNAHCAEASVARQITNKLNWKLWWPGEIKKDSLYYFQSCNYRIDKILLNGFESTIFFKQDSLKGFLQYIYLGDDSTSFVWTSTAKFANDPIKRFNQYFLLKKLSFNIESLLSGIKNHFNDPEKVYGLKINREKVAESSYISTKHTFNHYPINLEVYEMIHALQQYIINMGGEEKMYPMLHVEKEAPSVYETMVAIPTKTELASTNEFQLKKMILGNILTAEVKGGVYRVISGEEEFKNYISDYKILSPAIPFQSLVTNRLIETDSLKWITKLNYPIFQ